MFRNLFRSRRSPNKSARRGPGRKPFRPALEVCEDRCLLNSYTWVPVSGVYDGDFSNGAHWRDDHTGTTGVVPTAIDDASIQGSGYQVTITQQHEVNSLSNGPRLLIQGGGRLRLTDVGSNSFLYNLVMEQNSTLEVLRRTLFINVGSDLAGTVSVAQDATVQWQGGDNYLSPHVALTGVPGMGLGTFLAEGNDGGAPSIHLNTDLTAPNNFTLRNGTLDGPGTLTIDSTFNWIQGGAGYSYMAGMGVTNVLSGATLNIGGGGVTLRRRTLNNYGTTVMNATGPLDFADSGTFNNYGTVNLQTDVNFSNGSSSFNNFSVFNKTSPDPMNPGTSRIDCSFYNNSGTVNVQSGVLQLNGGGSSNGAFYTATGATVSFSREYLLDGAGLLGDGFARVQGGYPVTVTGNVTAANFGLDSDTLKGSGTLRITGTFDWTGGTMADPNGTTAIDAGATLSLHGNANKTLTGRTLNIAGAATWMDSGGISLSNNATIKVLAGGSFTIQNSKNMTGNGYFSNAGTLTKLASDGTTQMAAGIAFTNDGGTVSVQSGLQQDCILQIDNFTQNAGTTFVSANARLDSAGNLTLQAGTLSGAGIVRVNGGTGTVRNVAATIAPGTSNAVGTLTIDGNYVQEGVGTLSARLTHDGAGQPQSDQLRVTGRATLHGTLSLQALDSVFAAAEAFRVLQAQSLDSTFNTFDTITGLTLPDGHSLAPQYDANGLSLVVF
jgi:hypothetical protein